MTDGEPVMEFTFAGLALLLLRYFDYWLKRAKKSEPKPLLSEKGDRSTVLFADAGRLAKK